MERVYVGEHAEAIHVLYSLSQLSNTFWCMEISILHTEVIEDPAILVLHLCCACRENKIFQQVWKVPLQIPIEGYIMALAGLFAVLAYGVVTLTRIVVRKVASDRHKANLDKIQVYFMKTTQLPKDNSSIIKILKSMPYNPYESQEDRREKWKKPLVRGDGWSSANCCFDE